MKNQLTYPVVISHELPIEMTHPMAPKTALKLDDSGQTSFKGVAGKSGTWLVEPAAGWTIERLDVGLYKVGHTLGWTNTSVSVSLLVQPGSIQIIEHHPLYLVVQCSVEHMSVDLDFALVISRVLSPSV
jgi:hypothetical protein